jgi:iron(III) transport system substrate-binding protein
MFSKSGRKRQSSLPSSIYTPIVFGLLLLYAGTGWTASKPTTVSEIALHHGPDREQILIDGAKKERQLVFYNSLTSLDVVAQEFEKKYPFIRVSTWRSESPDLIKKVTEEYASGRYLVDVIETSGGAMAILQRKSIFQEYHSPDAGAYADEVKEKGKSGVYYLADRENYTGLGFNTKLIASADAPKNYRDLLDPRWKGKMTLAGGSIGPRWVGNVLNVMGREYLEKLSRQDMKVQNIAPAALINQVISGEILLSPTIQDSNVFTAKQTGAPVEWRPLEPVLANLGSSGITTKSPHPHAALLFLDYLHSKEGQAVLIKGGLSSPREDVGSLQQRFKKSYIETQYSLEEFEKRFNEWQELMRELFVRKR